MELTDKDYAHLDAYFEETLPETDRQLFEKRLEDEPEFAELAYQWLQKRTGLEAIQYRQQKAFLKKINADMPPLPIPPPSYRRWVLSAVAALILAATAYVVNNYWLKKETKKHPIAQFFSPYTEGVRGGTVEKTKRQMALETYEKAEYEAALPLLTAAFVEIPDTMLLFYKGVAAVGAEQPTTAIPILTSLQTSQVVPVELIPYYLGLAYAQNGEREKALEWLEKAKNRGGGEKRSEAAAAVQFLLNDKEQ